jgi:hypothetical protein
VYSLDFGTSNTVIARRNLATGQAEPVALPGWTMPDPPYLLPSLLYVQDASIETGTLSRSGQQWRSTIFQ